MILAFLGGGAAVGFAAPIVIAAAPAVSSTAVSAFTLSAGERGVSAVADGVIQYSQNIPEHDLALKTFQT